MPSDKELQKNIDDKKWFESEKKKQDMCGTYDFCKFCDISLPNPCAHAVDKIMEALDEKPKKK